jgi:ribonuclease III
VVDRSESYERLEFLGDSVLGLSVAEYLFRRFPDRPEGDLARIRAHVVSRPSCAATARALELDRALVREGLRRGGEAAAGAELLSRSDSVMAEVIEAVIGACFVAFGLERVAAAVVEAFEPRVEFALEGHVDYKTVLQEELARQGGSVTYELVEATGPDHDRRFTSVALVEGRPHGTGTGPSKKASEQAAAREALRRLAGSAGPPSMP